jgi:thioredoxin-like negative regulator of GroEL
MSSIPFAPRSYGDRDLPALIQRSTAPIVVESHYAGWDVPWHGLSDDAWKELAHEFDGSIEGARIETSTCRELAVRYALEVIPAVLVFFEGEVVARFSGSVRAAEVIEAVRAALEQARAVESARMELASANAAREASSPVRSVLQRRTSKAGREQSLAYAG